MILIMTNKHNSLSNTKWLCKYHIVFTPKYIRKIEFNQYKRDIVDIIKRLCKYKGVEIIEGHIIQIIYICCYQYHPNIVYQVLWDI